MVALPQRDRKFSISTLMQSPAESGEIGHKRYREIGFQMLLKLDASKNFAIKKLKKE